MAETTPTTYGSPFGAVPFRVSWPGAKDVTLTVGPALSGPETAGGEAQNG